MFAPAVPRRRLLLLGWDAADWRHVDPLLEQGLMPTLAGLIARGVRGNLATLQPVVSPMLWTSIATGRTADSHGVLGFVEPTPEGSNLRPWSSLSRHGKAVWNILQQNGWTCDVAGWWASHPAEPLNGAVVTDAFGETRSDGQGGWIIPPGTVHPPALAEKLGPMRFHAAELDQEHLLPFVPLAERIDQSQDRRLATLAGLIAEAVTMQGVATTMLSETTWDFAAVYFDSIDRFCHSFMPFHPPRLPHISEADFELYSGVIAAAYRFHDMMLERLLQLAGPDANIILCSDHGFLCGLDRPLGNPNDPAGPTLWHRDMGLLVMAGPDVRVGERIHGASLLDLTPTILTLAGLPCGQDMPGQPLAAALRDLPIPPRLPSWELVPGNDGQHPPGTPYPAAEANPDDASGASLVQQFVALGYIEDTGGDGAKAAEAADLEATYNLAQVYLSTTRPAAAVPLLEKLVSRRPWETRYLHQWANALTHAGWHAQSLEVLLQAYPETDPTVPPPVVLLLLARACLGLHDPSGAEFYLQQAAQAMPRLPGAHVELGQLATDARLFALAESALRRALELDGTFATAWQALAKVHLLRHENAAAAATARTAISHIRQLADAHFTLGVALARLGQPAEARTAFLEVTKMRPLQPQPWRWLATLPVDGIPEAPEEMLRTTYRNEASRVRRLRHAALSEQRDRAHEIWPVPDLPTPTARLQRAQAERPVPFAPGAQGASGRTLNLVSGLPRSGTSLAMQMLTAGGFPAQCDQLRPPDADNPAGYLEWEPIKRLATDPTILDDPALDHRVVKIVSPLLRSLPLSHHYRILYLRRAPAEVLQSQQKMRARLHPQSADPTSPITAEQLANFDQSTLTWLRSHPRCFSVLELDYATLLKDPAAATQAMADFFGPALLPHPEFMPATVCPDLHRNRT